MIIGTQLITNIWGSKQVLYVSKSESYIHIYVYVSDISSFQNELNNPCCSTCF